MDRVETWMCWKWLSHGGWMALAERWFFFGEGLRQEAQQEGTPKRHKPSRFWCVAFPSTLALLPNMADHVQKKRSGSSTQRRRRLVDTSASLGILMPKCSYCLERGLDCRVSGTSKRGSCLPQIVPVATSGALISARCPCASLPCASLPCSVTR